VHAPFLPPDGGKQDPHYNEEDHDSKGVHPSVIGES
jgi:hypothetical protein